MINFEVLIPFFIYLATLFIIGFAAHKILAKTKIEQFAEEFFIGSRSMNGMVLAFTMMASLASAGTFIGSPGLSYKYGILWLVIIAAQIPTGYFGLGLLGKKFAIIARKVGAYTVLDILKARFESPLIVIGGSIGTIIFMGAYMVAQFTGGGRVIQATTGLPYIWGVILFALVMVFYVTYGGFKAVIWTDLFQGLVMTLGAFVLTAAVLHMGGGTKGITKSILDINPDLLSFTGTMKNISFQYYFGYWVLLGVCLIGLPHATVRCMAYRDSKSMHQAMIIGTVIMGIWTIAFIALGTAANIFVPGLEVPDLVIPQLILHILPGWVAGIVLAAPLAAIGSTANSMLLIVSSTIVKDLYKNYINPSASDEKIKNMSLLITAIIGVLVLILSLRPVKLLEWIVFYAIGGLEATFFVPLVFGLFWKRANAYGGIFATFGGLMSYIIIEIFFKNPFGMHSIVTAVTISTALMVIVSYFTPKPSPEIIERFWGK